MFWMYFILAITIVANLIIMYFMMVRPLQRENKALKEEMHQQIKIGFYKEKEDE
jgi:preprotein translocase subunit YajC